MSLWRISSDRKGVAVVEFAILAPVLLLLVFGSLEIGHALYVRALLSGEIEKAGRSNSLENVSPAKVDAVLANQLRRVAGNLTIAVSRKSYRSYANIANMAEKFTDTNGNGRCDAGEPFEDLNGNGLRDLDSGKVGIGGAREVVVYDVKVTKPPLTPLVAFFTGSNGITFVMQTKLKNQPYTTMPSAPTGICP